MAKNKKKTLKNLGSKTALGGDKNGTAAAESVETTPAPPDVADTLENQQIVDGESEVDDSEPSKTPQAEDRNGAASINEKQESSENDNQQIEEYQAQISALQKRIKELEVQPAPSGDTSDLQRKLEEVTQDRDEAKASYDSLLSKLSGMKSVFSKMKEAQNELDETKDALQIELQRADEAEKGKSELMSKIKTLEQQTTDLNGECDRLTNSLTMLRREYQTKDDTYSEEKYGLEYQNSKLNKTISELKAEITELKTAKSEQALEMKELKSTSETLKEKVEEKQTEIDRRAREITDLEANITRIKHDSDSTIKTLEARVAELTSQLEEKDTKISTLTEQIEKQNKTIEEFGAEQEKIKLLENDVNAKQLLIGKLRHEAIILNEHLTKALSMIKQHLSSENNAIDKELVLNVLIGFLQFPRGDTKKYEALQLISALLNWDDDQKVAAGLSHSQPQRVEGRQSFVSLWTDFLEKESRGK